MITVEPYPCHTIHTGNRIGTLLTNLPFTRFSFKLFFSCSTRWHFDHMLHVSIICIQQWFFLSFSPTHFGTRSQSRTDDRRVEFFATDTFSATSQFSAEETPLRAVKRWIRQQFYLTSYNEWTLNCVFPGSFTSGLNFPSRLRDFPPAFTKAPTSIKHLHTFSAHSSSFGFSKCKRILR